MPMDKDEASALRVTHARADESARLFNERVWQSCHMADAIRLGNLGVQELVEGKGWGLMALDVAKMRFRAAVEMIEQMEAWK